MPSHLSDEFVERRNRSKYVAPSTIASNPSDFRVRWGHFFRAFPQPARGLAFGMIFFLSLTLRLHWLWVLPLLGLAVVSVIAVRRV